MRVFVSWSGDRSRAIAEILRDWLPYVLPSAEPWMSSTDIERGSRWSLEISEQLDKANIGIICLTPENLEAPWILFEAGALSKALSRTLVCTYLFQVGPTDIKGPLSQFQASLATREDTKKLLASMNRALGASGLADERFNKMFEVWWPELERKLNSLQEPNKHPVIHRSEREILEEILSLQRKSDSSVLLQELAKLIEGLHELRVGQAQKQLKKHTHETQLLVDTRPLVGPDGELVIIDYPLFGTVSDFLDELYRYVESVVPAITYGNAWVLKDAVSGKEFMNIGRSFARAALGKDHDDRSLEEVGIIPGMRFEAIKL
jgi:hypothetical protein